MLMSILSPAAWKRRALERRRREYPALAPELFNAKYVADGVISQFDMSVLPATDKLGFRQYVCTTLARKCQRLDGMFVCIGVSWGDDAVRILSEVGPGNDYYLIDSWDGRRTAANATVKAGYATEIEEVRARFTDYPNVRLIQGIAPAILSELPDGPIAWLHLDVGDSKTDIASLELLGSRIMPGGMVSTAAFGREHYDDADRAAFLAAAENAGLVPFGLPTGHMILMA